MTVLFSRNTAKPRDIAKSTQGNLYEDDTNRIVVRLLRGPRHGIGTTVIVVIVVVVIIVAAGAYLLASTGSKNTTSSTTQSTSQTTTTSSTSAPVSTTIVIIPQGASQGANFSPSSITVVVGVNNTIEWEDQDTGAPHNVYFTSMPTGASIPTNANTPTLSAGQNYTVTLTTPGSYHYECQFHNWMQATVTVVS